MAKSRVGPVGCQLAGPNAVLCFIRSANCVLGGFWRLASVVVCLQSMKKNGCVISVYTAAFNCIRIYIQVCYAEKTSIDLGEPTF